MMRFRLETGLLFFALLAAAVQAQSGSANGNGQPIVANGGLLHSLLAAPVAGHPYSATQMHSTERTLADGTRISHQGHHLTARDSEGRVHVEVRLGNGQNGQPDPAMVFVLDPVARMLTTWVAGMPNGKKEAVVYKLPAEALKQSSAAPQPPTASTPPQPIVTVEDLGAETLQGVPVAVQRTTTVVPIGRSGNDAPITKTHEVWTSQEMKLTLKEQWNDPRTGVRTVELANLSLADPDPALFHPPSGYAVKDAVQSLKELEQKLSATQN